MQKDNANGFVANRKSMSMQGSTNGTYLTK